MVTRKWVTSMRILYRILKIRDQPRDIRRQRQSTGHIGDVISLMRRRGKRWSVRSVRRVRRGKELRDDLQSETPVVVKINAAHMQLLFYCSSFSSGGSWQRQSSKAGDRLCQMTLPIDPVERPIRLQGRQDSIEAVSGVGAGHGLPHSSLGWQK